MCEQLSKRISKSILRNIEAIRLILTYPNAKEIVNQLDVDVYNSLFHASKIQNEEISLQVINMLLEKGANPYQKEENRQTILFYLAKEGKDITIQERQRSSRNFYKLTSMTSMILTSTTKILFIGLLSMAD